VKNTVIDATFDLYYFEVEEICSLSIENAYSLHFLKFGEMVIQMGENGLFHKRYMTIIFLCTIFIIG
jgi:hypothetical protein